MKSHNECVALAAISLLMFLATILPTTATATSFNDYASPYDKQPDPSPAVATVGTVTKPPTQESGSYLRIPEDGLKGRITDDEYATLVKEKLIPAGFDGFHTHMMSCNSGGFIDELEELGESAGFDRFTINTAAAWDRRAVALPKNRYGVLSRNLYGYEWQQRVNILTVDQRMKDAYEATAAFSS
jgi:hypothetical protein